MSEYENALDVSNKDKITIRKSLTPDQKEDASIQRVVDAALEGWRDELGSINAAKVTGASQPSWANFTDGIYAYEFSASAMNEVWLVYHINHDYKEGTNIYPHIHWSTLGTHTGITRWGIEYSYIKGHNQGAFPASTTVYLEQAASGTAKQHMITEVTDGNSISSVGIEPDGLILIRAFRDGGHDNDTCTDTAFAFYIDLHLQVSHFATPNKAPGFF